MALLRCDIGIVGAYSCRLQVSRSRSARGETKIIIEIVKTATRQLHYVGARSERAVVWGPCPILKSEYPDGGSVFGSLYDSFQRASIHFTTSRFTKDSVAL